MVRSYITEDGDVQLRKRSHTLRNTLYGPTQVSSVPLLLQDDEEETEDQEVHRVLQSCRFEWKTVDVKECSICGRKTRSGGDDDPLKRFENIMSHAFSKGGGKCWNSMDTKLHEVWKKRHQTQSIKSDQLLRDYTQHVRSQVQQRRYDDHKAEQLILRPLEEKDKEFTDPSFPGWHSMCEWHRPRPDCDPVEMTEENRDEDLRREEMRTIEKEVF